MIYQYIKESSWKDMGTFTEVASYWSLLPLTDNTNVYGYYGRFSQLVDLNSMYYTAYDYRTQIAVGGNYYVNPIGFGLEPVRTTQYEIGFKGLLAALKVTGFYKSQKGLPKPIGDPKGNFEAYNYEGARFATTRGLELISSQKNERIHKSKLYSVAGRGTGSSRAGYISTVDRGSEVPQMVNPLISTRSIQVVYP